MNIKKLSKAMLLATTASILFTACSGPDEKVVKSIALKYNIMPAQESDIKIVKSYEDKGKTVFILEIKGSICEMPMIEIDKNWSATGISCRG
jgi:outer membrane biogenesis lipoprotein LolB